MQLSWHANIRTLPAIVAVAGLALVAISIGAYHVTWSACSSIVSPTQAC
jgi:hypothetical protein